MKKRKDKMDQSRRFSLKNLSSFVQHLVVGGVACSLAFFFAVQFLTPVLSDESARKPPDFAKDIPQKTIGEAAEGFLQETGKVLKDTFSDQQSSSKAASPSSSSQAAPSKKQEEQNQKPVEVEDVDEALVEVESYMSPYIYDPLDRRDPFEDPIKARLRLQGPVVEEVIKPPTPPEMFSLQQIDLKGIIWRTTESPKALIKLPDGAFYTLLRGDKIGKNGVIFEIREDEMVVLETKIKQSGNKKLQSTSITIKRMDRLGQDVRRMQL
ncbi:MAG: pilus assembly protein PilP [Bdellovibrionales bacterium]|nr:pilus assembly protein PilP [Bdellovibrionales bacterium]